MYDKDQIIREIKRVAAQLGTTSLKRDVFISKTMIPERTIDFYIVSWNDALREAGLDESDQDTKEISDAKLLEDLIRLFNKYGEIPTLSLINDSGKYQGKEYTKRWRTLEDAFGVAKRKFPEYIRETEEEDLNTYDEEDPAADSSVFNLDDTLVSVNREDLILGRNDRLEVKKSDSGKGRREEPDSSDDEPMDIEFQSDELDLTNLIPSEDKRKTKKKRIIPRTIKPSEKKDDLEFRGLTGPPLSRSDVMLMFGMISEELSFVISSFAPGNECYEGRRRIGKGKWEGVRMVFTLKSTDMKDQQKITDQCDLLICWKHDWPECPMEVLELSAAIEELENYSPESPQD